MKYEFFEHTADAKFRAYGKNLEECFSNAAEAMISIMIKPETVEPKITKNISVNGTDLKSLLYNFLEELLFLIDAEFFIMHRVASIKINPMGKKYMLNATIEGDKLSEKYSTTGDVKAVTYNEMEVKENYVQVVVDI